MKRHLFLRAALLASAIALPASAEIMQGQHVLVIGQGVGIPATDLNPFENVDLDQ